MDLRATIQSVLTEGTHAVVTGTFMGCGSTASLIL